MKKLKFILPLAAFAIAMIGAFTSNAFKSDNASNTVKYYEIQVGKELQCRDCELDGGVPDTNCFIASPALCQCHFDAASYPGYLNRAGATVQDDCIDPLQPK